MNTTINTIMDIEQNQMQKIVKSYFEQFDLKSFVVKEFRSISSPYGRFRIFVENKPKEDFDLTNEFELFVNTLYESLARTNKMIKSSLSITCHSMYHYPELECDKLKMLFDNNNVDEVNFNEVYFIDKYEDSPVTAYDYVKHYDKEFYNKYKLLLKD